MRSKIGTAVLGLTAWVAWTPAQASELSINGFLSAFGGKVLSGDGEAYSALQDEYGCPKCFVTDYPFVGVYDEDWSFAADTSVGIQLNAQISDELSATTQIVAHGSQDFAAKVEWAYFSYTLNEQWTLQGGRKRLPLFYYSDFFDVGYAYTWVRAPADLYGWQISGYDGFNTLYRSEWGPFSVTGNVWVGADTDDDNQTLSKLYYYQPIRETWKNMLGANLDLSWDWLDVRFVYMQNDVDRVKTTTNTIVLEDEPQFFYGFSLNIDWKNLIVRSEYNMFDRPDAKPDSNTYYAWLAAVGYRFGDVTLMLSKSSFEEIYSWTCSNSPSCPSTSTVIEDDGEVHDTSSLTIRWDFMSSVALKVQYDRFKDDTSWNYDNGDGTEGEDKLFGNSSVIAIGIDAVF